MQINEIIGKFHLKFSCSLAGCQFRGYKEELERHEKNCRHRLVECPVKECRVSLESLIRHCRDEHGIKNEDNGVKTPIFYEGWEPVDQSDYAWEFGIYSCRGKSFISKLMKRNGWYQLWVYHLGSTEETRNMRVVITSLDSKTTIIDTNKVFSIDQTTEECLMDKENILCFED